MIRFLIVLFASGLLATAHANQGGPTLDKAPDHARDMPALQHGAKIFINYCLSCHSASFMRYSRLTNIGITPQQIKDNLLFTTTRIGDPMTIALRQEDAKLFFGTAPPDLTLVARARNSELGSGSDWLYSYLRGFYRDPNRPSGWNNRIFQNVNMPAVFWELQGEQQLSSDKTYLTLTKPGKLTPEEFDAMVGNLVGFLNYISEPDAENRKSIGVFVLIGLVILGVFAYALKLEYWKDVH